MKKNAGFRVTMVFTVFERNTNVMLMLPFVATYYVQPPAYVVGDPAMLDMQLEMLAKLKCLVTLRTKVKNGDPAVVSLVNQNFSVRGKILEFIPPEKQTT